MTNFLSILRCPKSGEQLDIIPNNTKNIIKKNSTYLISESRNFKYPIIKNVIRFVEKDNYAQNFGLQWNFFSKTQLDSFSGQSISYDRFWKSTGWQIKDLKDKWVLDIGCGSGRFAEIALKAGANVVALDYSSSVDACYQNLSHFENFYVIQADIYELPFKEDSFDFVYSLGVLQHTPNVEKAFKSIPIVLKINGKNLRRFLLEESENNIKYKISFKTYYKKN